MTKSDIFEIKIPENDQVKMLLNMQHLNKVFESSRSFEKKAAMLAAHFPINANINKKIKNNPDYFETWQKLCSYLFSYLLGPAKFFYRSDADELMCLPITTKIDHNGLMQTCRAISVYNSTKRIGTLFFKDAEFNNEFSFYGQNEFMSHGPWASKVRGDVQNYNLYGLNKSNTNSNLSNNYIKSTILESNNTVGCTITVQDLFSNIEQLKRKYMGI